jgi:hypothetical protein
MGRLDLIISEQFARWEERGRGWQVWSHPVAPEPAYVPFTGFRLPRPDVEVDDGRRPGLLASLFDAIDRRINPKPPIIPEPPEEAEPEPECLERSALAELQTILPAGLDIKHEAFADLLEQLGVCHEPLAFELFGTPDQIVAQFTAGQRDVPMLERQLKAYFPEVAFRVTENTLLEAWCHTDGESAIVEFGLEQEFLLPLATGKKLDPFIGLIGALNELKQGELALFQVLFQSTEKNWEESAWNAISDGHGKALFVNRPDLIIHAKEKFASPLYAAVVRIATKAGEFDRAWQIARELAFALRVFASREGNALIPLHNEDYLFEAHEIDVLQRQSHRSGMLLNANEIMGFVHFPSPAVRSAKLSRQVERTKPAPENVLGNHSYLLGNNVHLNRTVEAGLSPEQRVRHMHIIGASGTGKSTLLFNLIRQDIENGEGIALLDPHGDLVDRILGIIPPERVGDVVLVDPSDEQYSVGFNIFDAHSDLEKNLLASDLVSVFQRLSTSWGDQMGSVLQNAILAFLESDQGGTLADLRRFLIDPAFRDKFLNTVRDASLVFYWRKAFVQLSGNKSIGSVLTRLETFLSPKPIRYMVSQPVNRLDFGQILDTGKIFLAKLPQGQMGKENAFLLGSLLVAKFQQLAMGRQAQKVAARKDFWLYIDEFQNFISASMAEILSGARKYRLGLILAHQELRQLERDREVASAVLSNPYTRIVFRVGDADARALESGFSFFEARDLQNLETGQAICRVEKADGDFNLTVPLSEDPDPELGEATRQNVIAASRAKYATPRAEVEAALLEKLRSEDAAPKPKPKPASPQAPKPLEMKVAEVPEPTVSEKESLASPAPPKPKSEIVNTSITTVPIPEQPIVRERPPLRELGRGGAQHQAIQKRLKAAAEAMEFFARIEAPILEGPKGVDLLLERSDISIACEIAISTTIDHEVGNVQKCLKAGIANVAVIAIDEDRLRKIKAAVFSSLGAEVSAKVRFYDPDQFIAYLQTLTPPSPSAPAKAKVRRGYKVKHSIPNISPEEQKLKEDEAIRSIAEAMQTNSPRTKRKRPEES